MPGQVKAFFHKDTFSLTYVLHDGPGTEAAIIDAVLDYNPVTGGVSTDAADEVIAFIREHNLKLRYILETHVHADHLTAAKYLRDDLGGKIAIGANTPVVQKEWSGRFNNSLETVQADATFDQVLSEGDTLPLNGRDIGVLDTPGHTPSCITYTYDDGAFVGDTLFMPDYGTARCDFPGGNGKQLFESFEKILGLGDETKIYVCHDYQPGGRELEYVTTVADHKARNIHLTENKTAEAYAAFRAERDKGLATPRLLYPALQVNMRGGNMPAAESNGTVYLKQPISGFPEGKA